jgi:hypothetical protein
LTAWRVGVTPLGVGSAVEVAQFWEYAGEMTIEAGVVEPVEVMGAQGQ